MANTTTTTPLTFLLWDNALNGEHLILAPFSSHHSLPASPPRRRRRSPFVRPPTHLRARMSSRAHCPLAWLEGLAYGNSNTHPTTLYCKPVLRARV